MNFFKSLSPIVIVFMLATLWGCSGDQSATTATSSNQTKTSGKSLVDDLQITRDTVEPFLDQGQPSVAYDIDNNRYLVVWQHMTAAGSSEIRGRLYAGTGTGTTSAMTPVAAEFVINASGGTRQQPKVSHCNDPANPRYLVVWSDSRNGYGQIYGRHFDKDGIALAADFSISTHTPAVDINQIEPDIVYNQVSKKFIVAWTDTSTYDTTANAANSLTVQGSSCSNTNSVKYVPLPLVDNYLIRSTEITPSSGALANTKHWSGLLSKGPIAYNDAGYGFINNYSKSWTAFSDESKPKILVSNTDGTYYVAWSGSNYDVSLEGTYTVASGFEAVNLPRSVGGNFIVGDFETIARVGQSIISATVYLANGSTRATSATVTGVGTDTITVTIDAGSNLIGTPQMVVKLNLTGGASTCTYEPEVIFTAAEKSGQLITTIKNDGLGLSKYYTFGTVGASSPSVALDPNTNRMLLVWEDAGQVINGQLVDLSTFSNYGSTIPITTTKSTSPVVSFDNVNQRFLVAWEDARNQSANISNMDIYAQFIDPQGQLSGGNSIVSVAPGNQLAPALAFGGVNFRQFMVVWKDGRASGNSDIWGQTIEFSQSPQLVVADSTGSPILSGSIDFGNVALGQTKDITLKLRNDGNTQLTINQDPLKTIVPDKPYTLLTPMPVTISPGTSYDLIIRFAPTAIGSYAGTTGNKFQLQIDSNGGQSITYFNGAGTGSDPLAITTSSLPDGTPGVAYTTTTLTAFGGVFPYKSWTPIGGLPPGLALDPNTGVISGTPTAATGDYPVTISLTDNAGTVATKLLTIKIRVFSITTTTLNSATNGLLYTQTIATTAGGVAPFAWTVSADAINFNQTSGLPAGMAIDSVSGVISGIPTSSGPFSFTVKVTDSNGATSTKPLTIQVQQGALSISTNSISDMKTNTPMSITLQASGGTLPYTWSQTKGGFPAGVAAFDVNGGNLSGTPTVAGDYSFEITVTDALGSTAKKLYTVSVRESLSITNSSMKSWALNQSGYSETLTAIGGRGTYTWSIVTGALPAGLTLNATTGIVSGTPTASGSSVFTVQLSDSGAVQEKTTKQFTIIISTNMVIATTSMAVMKTGVPASVTLQASGGTTPYTWSLTKGALPSGSTTIPIQRQAANTGNIVSTLGLDIGGGNIEGTPAVAGDYSFEITVTDALGQSAVQVFNVTVRDTLIITSSSLKSAQLNQAGYAETLTATGGRGVYTWSLLSGSLPTGLTLNSTSGIISGTPTQNGTYTFTIQLSDSGVPVPEKATKQFTVVVVSPLVITTTTLPQAPLNALYSQTLSALGGREPYSWSVLQGTLPTGLTIGAATGIITGIPKEPGTYTFVVNLLDSDGKTATQSISISTSSITTPPTALSITTATLPAGEVTKTYTSTTLAATGGTIPRTWSVINGTLPPGMSLASATGIISGTPTAGGNYDLIFQVIDADLKSATRTLSISVADPTVSAGTVQFLDGGTQTSSLLYGNVYRGSSIKKTLSISNATSAAVSITNISSSIPTVFIVSGAPFNVAANSTAPLDISFMPTLSQPYNGTITLTDLNGSKYQLAVSGTGIGVDVSLKSGSTGTVSYFNERLVSSLSTSNKPATFNALSAADFQIVGVPSGSTVTVNVTFAAMPTTPIFYKLDANNAWIELTGATVVGNVVSFDIADNSNLDSNTTAGIISGDSIVVGTIGTTSGTTGTTVGGGTVVASSTGGGGGGCFIATAAFGSYLDPHVMVLRHFRDDVLLQSELGTAFVTFYYKHSPPIADFIAQHDTLRTLMRFALTPLIFAVKYPLIAALLFVIAGARFIRRRMTVKVQSEMVQQAG